jgi:hypothetical protein
MSSQVTLDLPDDVMRQATHLATGLGRPVEDFLVHTVQKSLQPSATSSNKKFLDMTDEEILAFSQAEMSSQEDRRLSDLLNRQQAGLVTASEKAELTGLMALYQEMILNKAQALREAVRRGLREPLSA